VHLPSLSGKTLDSPSHLMASSLHLTLREKAQIAVLSDIGTSFVIPWLHLFGRKVVWWVDGPAWLRGKWGPLARAYLRGASWLGVRRSDAMVCDTTVAQRYYRRTQGRDSVFIPYGATVETSTRQTTLHRFGVEPDEYVLFVGRLTPEKGVSLLIEAFEQLTTDRKLVIVGDNPYDKDYVTRLRATADRRIVFTGYQFDEAFHELMQNCCVYVQPSEVEGTSPVVLSAMGHGRAVLVNGIEENLETVGDGGLAFARNDVGALHRALAELLGNASRREELGQRARERVERVYNWDRITDQFEAVFHDLAAGRTPHA
jgi:glycosyltransferase involved in cell wall biosynthesis